LGGIAYSSPTDVFFIIVNITHRERNPMYINWTTDNNHSFQSAIQLRLFPQHTARTVEPLDEPQLRNWSLRDIRALAIDIDVEIRRMAALSKWVVDSDLQLVLATDPDEQVVLNLLSQVDPHAEANHHILASPHTLARRELARRNLATASLLALVDDSDEVVRTAARTTLERRGVLAISGDR
jgi:hypothetical protein